MSCVNPTKGRKLVCKGAGGGLKAVGFTSWSNENIVVATNGEVSTLPTGITSIYRYELKNSGNNYVEEIATDSETRHIGYNGTLSLVLQKLDIETRNEIKILAMAELTIFLEANDGNIYVIGAENGAELTGGSFVTGGVRGEMSGSNLTFTTSENEPYLTLSTAAKALYVDKKVEGV